MNYSELKARIVDVLADPQVDDAKAAHFIEQAEPKMERDLILPGGTPRQMLTAFSGTTDDNAVLTLPTDYLGVRSVRVGTVLAKYASPEHIYERSGYGQATVNMEYYQRLPVLSDSNTSNWLLSAAMDLYLYGACVQYETFGQDITGPWAQFYADALKSVKEAYVQQPKGGFSSLKRAPFSAVYTIIGEQMIFASMGTLP